MSDPAPRRSPVDLARHAVRMTLSRGTRAAAAPVRAIARAGRDDTDPRWAGVSWLWQPGWGRHAHDRLYRTANPYGIDANPYEQQKYTSIMNTLAGRRYRRVLEIGCGEGHLSERLAGVTGELLGVDISADATARAAARVPSATFETRMLPAEMPAGTFDLIVCSDVLYYWEPTTLRTGLDRLIDHLEAGGVLLAYHYRGDFGQVNRADHVHDRLRALVAGGKVHGVVSERIDDLGPDGAGVRFDVVATAPVPSIPAQRPEVPVTV
ncbi:class I SAM-dependent DNA methyltransferase [Pseudonocardia endophytica]|uniref:Nodulation protein S (NodS) n=1 Tax=Pseudonocardia endophytica TaxID=401976 RepID=A0A4R1HHB2_PSEEN|nr:class I SAM-dependent methyltransferase [Pseudonocardia endophytica]TCK19825.1 nodulation protein S (NodS) [Pseudonocardia endophytica]